MIQALTILSIVPLLAYGLNVPYSHSLVRRNARAAVPPTLMERDADLVPRQTYCAVDQTACSTGGCCVGSCCGDGCCPNGYTCEFVGNTPGCCPDGQVCSNQISGCTDSSYVQCSGYDFCCPAGETCSQDASGNGQCSGVSIGNGSTTSTASSPTSSSTAAATCVSTYTAGVGDTCASIGAKYGLTGDQILAANTFLTCSDIWQWTPVCIPPPSCVQTYTAGSGETCSSIATKFGLTAAAIQAANTFVDCSNIWQYTPICIPPGGAPATCTQTYTSVAGDNCDSIGAKFGVSGDQILAWNTFLTCSDIWVNTPVCV